VCRLDKLTTGNLRATRTSDLVRAKARHQANAVQVHASALLIFIELELRPVNAMGHLTGALLAIRTCVLFDVPVLVVASEQGIRTTVFEAAVVMSRVLLTADLFLAAWVIEESEVVCIALLHVDVATKTTTTSRRTALGSRGGCLVRIAFGQRRTSLVGGDTVITSIASREAKIIKMLTIRIKGAFREDGAMIWPVSVGIPGRVGDQTELLVDSALEVRAAVLKDAIVVRVVVDRADTLLATIFAVKSAEAIGGDGSRNGRCTEQHTDDDRLSRCGCHDVVGGDGLSSVLDEYGTGCCY
jgi:hypothetical protein